nr:nucleotide-binding alpha-beta plait domain-containing protein [Tanacetum cinerariifolium]
MYDLGGTIEINANVARFNRENLKSNRIVDKTAKRFNKSSHNTFHKTVGNKDIGNSFVNVVEGSGFDVLKISYLGELWVLTEFESAKVKDLFKENGRANSWFSVLNQASEDFTLGGRIAWVEVEGIPFKLWSVYWTRAKEVPGWNPKFTKEEEEDDVSVEDNHGGIHSDQEINNCNDVSDMEEVPETCFNVPEGQKGNLSEDPFGIYPLLNKDKNIREHKINEEESSLKYPPGFTPVGNLNEGHLDGGCEKKVNEEVA